MLCEKEMGILPHYYFPWMDVAMMVFPEVNCYRYWKRINVNSLGLSEVRWPVKSEMVLGNCTIFYSGEVKAGKGAAVVMRDDNVGSATKVECYSDRLIL